MHEQFLLAALEQAYLGRGSCAPNPSVGAVAVCAGEIIAQSWHHGAGTPHAEKLLLEKITSNLSDVTLYVTLEPCNHWGKTPPCVDAIIEHGIKKVVYAYRDPNPIVKSNNTPRILGDHGVEFLHYPLDVIDQFYESYHYWMVTNKPWVTVKLAQTMDGKIAGVNGERLQLSNAACADFTHQQRLHTDIILTSARTVNQDDPLLNVRLQGNETAKPVAILDCRGTLKPTAKIFQTAKHCHIYHGEDYPSAFPPPNSTLHYIPTAQGLLNLEAVIQDLGQQGFHDVWVEAGGTLFSALHLARLVNRTYLYIVPKILGQAAVSAFHHIDLFNHPRVVKWQAMGDNMVASLDWSHKKA